MISSAEKAGQLSEAGLILENLDALQFGATERVMLFTQDPAGLGAQISRRLLGLRLALICQRKVVFPWATEPPYTQVFQPLHSPFPYQTEGVPLLAQLDAEDPTKVGFLKFWDLWEDETRRQSVLGYLPPGLESMEQAQLYLDGILLNFCRLTPEMKAYTDDAIDTLGVDAKTLGVHLRRGDKRVETPYIPIEIINEAIRSQISTGKFDSIFVATDDPNAVQELVFPKSIELKFDRAERRYNNANHRLLASDPKLAEQETRTAVKNIYLLGACGAVVGQNNAHFSTLSASLIYARTGVYLSTLIDGNIALQRSYRLRLYYAAGRSIRRLAKFFMRPFGIRGSIKQ